MVCDYFIIWLWNSTTADNRGKVGHPRLIGVHFAIRIVDVSQMTTDVVKFIGKICVTMQSREEPGFWPNDYQSAYFDTIRAFCT